ncbi:DUF3141 domain-containing protein [Microvirga sp. SYSU G3D207]|uniref:DUF3141 domain-containing protein n=2 Tax=Microvirga arsenatis TaxID=2692265 RepID=A0ABW9Z2R5_9HYPH|nr:DUF3141 domain-containing protein [Microvirga arsenatis]NBJ26820.1 DUF3141 domain-containing protein [Microvirga arsenatis]
MALNELELTSAELPLQAVDKPTVGSRDLPFLTQQAGHWQEPTLNLQPVGVQMAQRDFWMYMKDVGERSILFLDTLRQRADNMLAHDRAGKPPLLDFDYEIILDAGHFKPPTNYSLLRITRVGGDCLADCVDSTKPPVVVFDPRAGHGPGIGGFKRDSEVGLALRAGHPVYFVAFAPEPVLGQTLLDVLHTLRRFVEEVANRHPGRAPILYGNCQAGWAITILAADCAGLVGPAVLNGSPLSYWAGEAGINPMRIAGGFVGGAWLAHLLGDLGQGRFDGAWLVQNFENLKPEAVWEKYANLFANIETERERFLEFERWWNGFYFLSREEIVAIVENLFVGNRLEEGLVQVCDGCHVDLRQIGNPLVIFASYGDNITPPHQALGWIPAVYASTEDLKQAGQRIVYLTNPHIGHLGIFVSAKVANLEHRAILENLSRVGELEPGLYEMRIGLPATNAEQQGTREVTFEERRVEDLDFGYPRRSFEHVREISEANEAAYRMLWSSWIQAAVTPWSAAMAEVLHPMRVSRTMFSEDFSPWMRGVRMLAAMEQDHTALPSENPFKAAEAAWFYDVTRMIEAGRRIRDAWAERLFATAFGGGLSSPPPARRHSDQNA